MNDLNFWSGKNYMKRDSSSGSTAIAAPVTSAYSGTVYITQEVITHNLNFVPYCTVEYEPFKDGVIWEPLGTRSQAQAINPRDTAEAGPYLIFWPTSTTLTIEIGYASNTLTGTYNVYWNIYKDYGIA